MKVKVIPVGNFPTKKDASKRIFLYFVEAGSIKVRASSYDKELSNGDMILLTQSGDYWNISVASGAPLEVELLNPE